LSEGEKNPKTSKIEGGRIEHKTKPNSKGKKNPSNDETLNYTVPVF